MTKSELELRLTNSNFICSFYDCCVTIFRGVEILKQVMVGSSFSSSGEPFVMWARGPTGVTYKLMSASDMLKSQPYSA